MVTTLIYVVYHYSRASAEVIRGRLQRTSAKISDFQTTPSPCPGVSEFPKPPPLPGLPRPDFSNFTHFSILTHFYFFKTYLLTPRLLQTSYVNALILESRSIIISSFNFKELWEILEFCFFQKFSDVRTFTNHPPSPCPGMSEISKPPPPPHLPDVLCRRPLSGIQRISITTVEISKVTFLTTGLMIFLIAQREFESLLGDIKKCCNNL